MCITFSHFRLPRFLPTQQAYKTRVMHAVVNHLQLNKTVDWVALSHKFEKFEAMLQAHYPTLRGSTLVRAGDEQRILIVAFDTPEAFDDISKNGAAP